MGLVKRLPLLAAPAVLIALFATPAVSVWRVYACSCAATTLQQDTNSAAVVFLGTVTSIVEPTPSAGVSSSAQSEEVRFSVQTVYKGSPGSTPTVATAQSDASCGVPFVIGRQYTVFAQRSASGLSTNECTGTTTGRLFGRAAIGAPPTGAGPPLWTAALLSLAGFGVVGVGLIAGRREG